MPAANAPGLRGRVVSLPDADALEVTLDEAGWCKKCKGDWSSKDCKKNKVSDRRDRANILRSSALFGAHDARRCPLSSGQEKELREEVQEEGQEEVQEEVQEEEEEVQLEQRHGRDGG